MTHPKEKEKFFQAFPRFLAEHNMNHFFVPTFGKVNQLRSQSIGTTSIVTLDYAATWQHWIHYWLNIHSLLAHYLSVVRIIISSGKVKYESTSFVLKLWPTSSTLFCEMPPEKKTVMFNWIHVIHFTLILIVLSCEIYFITCI